MICINDCGRKAEWEKGDKLKLNDIAFDPEELQSCMNTLEKNGYHYCLDDIHYGIIYRIVQEDDLKWLNSPENKWWKKDKNK